MKPEEFRPGVPVIADGRRGIATELELCNDETLVIHVAFPMKEAQSRVPIERVEVQK